VGGLREIARGADYGTPTWFDGCPYLRAHICTSLVKSSRLNRGIIVQHATVIGVRSRNTRARVAKRTIARQF